MKIIRLFTRVAVVALTMTGCSTINLIDRHSNDKKDLVVSFAPKHPTIGDIVSFRADNLPDGSYELYIMHGGVNYGGGFPNPGAKTWPFTKVSDFSPSNGLATFSFTVNSVLGQDQNGFPLVFNESERGSYYYIFYEKNINGAGLTLSFDQP